MPGPSGESRHVARIAPRFFLAPSRSQLAFGTDKRDASAKNSPSIRAAGEVPLLLPAWEIRYEVYPCIFEDRQRASASGRATQQDLQSFSDLFARRRGSTSLEDSGS
ncbi:hypothetical protein KM043_010981 [Ampulex compressa]|nr:hypothetical protein KM043_010981 [Ampulex compressa]